LELRGKYELTEVNEENEGGNAHADAGARRGRMGKNRNCESGKVVFHF
jgi:hypothetical protein